MNGPIQAGDMSVKLIAEHAMKRGHSLGFERGRLFQIEREMARLKREADALRIELARMGDAG